jgi:cold shock CspA family protein
MRGYVDFWKADRGFGFIIDAENKTRYFAHISAFEKGAVPTTGSLVDFIPGATGRGPIATHIHLLDVAETIAALLGGKP